MKNKEICGICNLAIDISKEYCQFTHFVKKDKILASNYYHVSCFRDKLLNNAAMNQMQMKAMQLLDKVAGNIA